MPEVWSGSKADSVFVKPDKEGKELKELKRANDKLLKKVGQLTVEVDFFCGSLRDTVSKEAIESLSDRRPVGVSRNRYCEPAGLNRTSHYYKRKGESDENQTVMRKIDEYYQDHPTAGVATMTNMLCLQGFIVNPKRVRRLLRKMGLQAVYPQRRLSRPGRAEYVHPYLPRGLRVVRRNQVWSTDISYIPMEHGFMYLYAIIDVYSRYIVGWRLSNTLEGSNCVELL